MPIKISYGNPALVGAASFGIAREKAKRKYGVQAAGMVQQSIDRRDRNRKYEIERQDRLNVEVARLAGGVGGRRRIGGGAVAGGRMSVGQLNQWRDSLSQGQKQRLSLRERASGGEWTPGQLLEELERSGGTQSQRQQNQLGRNADGKNNAPNMAPTQGYRFNAQGFQMTPEEIAEADELVQVEQAKQAEKDAVRAEKNITDIRKFNTTTIGALDPLPDGAPRKFQDEAAEALAEMRELGLNPEHDPTDPANQEKYDDAMERYNNALAKGNEWKDKQDAEEKAEEKRIKDEAAVAKTNEETAARLAKEQEAADKVAAEQAAAEKEKKAAVDAHKKFLLTEAIKRKAADKSEPELSDVLKQVTKDYASIAPEGFGETDAAPGRDSFGEVQPSVAAPQAADSQVGEAAQSVMEQIKAAPAEMQHGFFDYSKENVIRQRVFDAMEANAKQEGRDLRNNPITSDEVIAELWDEYSQGGAEQQTPAASPQTATTQGTEPPPLQPGNQQPPEQQAARRQFLTDRIAAVEQKYSGPDSNILSIAELRQTVDDRNELKYGERRAD